MGERCVEKLNGMFAFGIWDNNQRRLVLARDRIGQKPLYYAQDGDAFLFASEIKAILPVFRQPRKVDWESVHYYLSLRFIPPPNTILNNIRKLPAAHILVLQDGETTIQRYWTLDFNHKLDLTDREFADNIREQIIRAVRSHMISDVPVGAFLSGGLDSSMVVGVTAKNLGEQLETFAVGVQEDDFNELPYARMVADHLGTCHIESSVASNLIELLPRMIWHLDEPSDPIAACMFHAAALASRHVKVVLGGDGGDELFAGFDRYRGNGYIDAYRLIPNFLRNGLLDPILRAVPDSFTYKSLTQKVRWVHSLSNYSTVAEQYAAATCFFRFSHQEKAALFSPDLWRELSLLDAAQAIVQPFNSPQATDNLDRMLYTDFMTRLPEHSLMLTDRMTMAHSLEARSPFLDHELVEYLAVVPARLKI
jgi:asparagine synthase (glutamine-hydrolysing)